MKSIQEYQELSRKPHTAKRYQDSRTIIVVEEDRASTKPILNMEEPVLRHVSWISTTAIRKKKLSSTVMEARIREEIKRRKLEVNIWI